MVLKTCSERFRLCKKHVISFSNQSAVQMIALMMRHALMMFAADHQSQA